MRLIIIFNLLNRNVNRAFSNFEKKNIITKDIEL